MDLRDQLQAHLGSAFVIERELGGGGMSRVFVATDVRLSRKVVIKVLSPELVAGLNAERFEREILLAASLQQANIVGVLAAGEVEGLPYFTMPFVEGESLRARLTGGGLPIPDVMAILRDVAKALGYAHSRGVVHRDIKPDNVLLSAGTAMVTDFGIAKALSASRAESGGTLTSVGTSIGTPAYMAPEQVAGDPNIDHRVDLYSLGCMTYELLTGRSPFADRTPQRMLAAHLSETPTPVNVLRPDSPAPLNALVARLLQKDPDQRVQSANEVLQALDALSTTSSSPSLALSAPGALPKVLGLYAVALGAVAILAKAAVVGIGLPDWVFPGAIAVMLLGLPALLFTAYAKRVARKAATATPTLTPGGTMVGRSPSGTMATIALKASPHMSWKRTARGGVYAMGAFVFAVAAFMVMRAFGIGAAGSLFAKGQLAADDRIVLADFNVAQEDSALAPILSAAVRAAMSQSKSVRLMDQADIAQVLDQMQRGRGARLVPDLAREVATRANAKAVLGGRLARIGAGYVVSLELTSADRGVSLAAFQATANGAGDLLPVVDKLTKELRGKIGESLRQVQRSIPLQQATTSSLEALKKYSEASQANDVDGDYDRAVRLAREAVALDSTFALAWRKMAVALSNGSGSEEAKDSALKKAFQYADRLPDREKYLAIGVYYNRSRTAGDRGKALAAYQAAYAADSNNTIAANNLATIYGDRGQVDSALRYSRRQYQIDRNGASAAYLATALVFAGQPAEATALLDSLHKAAPQFDNFDGVLAARFMSYLATEKHDSLRILLEVLHRSPSPSTRLMGIGMLANEDMVNGRMKQATMLADEGDSLRASRGAGKTFDGLTVAAVDIIFRGDTAQAVKRLDAIVSGKQWATAAPADRPYFFIATLYARTGNADRARELLKRFESESPRAKAPASRPGKASVEAAIAVADGKFDDAVRLFRGANAADDGEDGCRACTEFDLGRAFDAAGQKDSVMVHFENYLRVPVVERAAIDFLALAAVEKRLGELYDSKSDRTNAIKHYAAFVDQWKDADADMQPVVATVKRRLTELRGQEGK